MNFEGAVPERKAPFFNAIGIFLAAGGVSEGLSD